MKIIKSNSNYLKELVIDSKRSFKIAGLDIGNKHIGVALSDETRVFAFPYKFTIKRNTVYGKLSPHDFKTFTCSLNKLVSEEDIRLFVVGLPIYKENVTPLGNDIIELIMYAKVENSIKSKDVDILCTFWDEYDSSVKARSLSRRLTSRRSVIVKQKDG